MLPSWVWERQSMRDALRARNIAAVVRLVRQYSGASQGRLAGALGLAQGRVSEVLNGKRTVSALEMFERIADGLSMPDDARVLLGLAPVHPAGLDHLGPSGRAELLAVYPSQSAALADLREAITTASRIDVLAVRGLGILGLNDSLLRGHIEQHHPRVRVCLLDPDSGAARYRAEEIGESAEAFSAGIRLSVARLRELAERTGTVECYLYSLLPTWRVIAVDDVVFVSAFGPRREGHHSAMYKITETVTGALHAGFLRFHDELRRSAERVV